ncbi:MAG: DNA replication and repair protein RecF, partial [Gemmatimonadota bacterium]
MRNFRNLTRVELELPLDGVAIIGDNGHGKTNLLEAIAYFSILRSLRGVRDRDLVCFGERAFFLSADAEGGVAAGGSPVHVTVGFETGT